MESLAMIIGIVMLVLNLVGIIWLGIVLGHWFLTLIGYIIALVIVGSFSEMGFIILMGITSVATIVVIIVYIVKMIKDKKLQKQQNELNIALLNAVNEGDKQTVQELIEKGGNVNYIGYVSSDKKSLLEIAVENNDKEIVSLLLNESSNINFDDGKLLTIAIKNSDKEIVSLLLEKGANVNLVNDGKTPLDFAKDEEIITLLRKHGAKTKAEIDEENRIKAEEKFFKAVEYYSKGDYSMACFYLEEAANLGHIEAHHYLGNIYGSGLGCAKDIDKAIKFFEVAANAGIINAQANLGALYFQKGRNISYDNAGAKMMAWSDGYRWSKQAADQGSTDAMFNLGIHDIETEYFDEAGKWLEKAARLGHPQALDALKELCSRGLYYVNM